MILKLAEMDLQHAHMGIDDNAIKRNWKRHRQPISATSQKTFDETKLHEIEAEQFHKVP